MTAIFSVPAAYYAASVADFIGETTESILGTLTAKSSFAVDPPQRDAWVGEIESPQGSARGHRRERIP